MINFAKLIGYQKGTRPVQPESLPAYIDRELARISVVTGEIVRALQELDARLTLGGL